MEFERISYRGWPDCVRLTNGRIEVIAAGSFGPRILHFSVSGGENVFAHCPQASRPTPIGTWRMYGGHRLWVAPEDFPKTYHPDSNPVQVDFGADKLRLAGRPETHTGLRKTIEVRLPDGEMGVHVRHRIENLSGTPIAVSPWALSVMAPGGTAVIPLRPPDADPEGMLPTHTISLWPYSDPADPRWTWGQDFLRVRQDPAHPAPQKLGVTGQEGWAAYVRNGTAFIKAYRYEPGRQYPDGNVSLEIYTDHRFLEVETLGPLQVLAHGEEALWDETWWLTGQSFGPSLEAQDWFVLAAKTAEFKRNHDLWTRPSGEK